MDTTDVPRASGDLRLKMEANAGTADKQNVGTTTSTGTSNKKNWTKIQDFTNDITFFFFSKKKSIEQRNLAAHGRRHCEDSNASTTTKTRQRFLFHTHPRQPHPTWFPTAGFRDTTVIFATQHNAQPNGVRPQQQNHLDTSKNATHSEPRSWSATLPRGLDLVNPHHSFHRTIVSGHTG